MSNLEAVNQGGGLTSVWRCWVDAYICKYVVRLVQGGGGLTCFGLLYVSSIEIPIEREVFTEEQNIKYVVCWVPLMESMWGIHGNNGSESVKTYKKLYWSVSPYLASPELNTEWSKYPAGFIPSVYLLSRKHSLALYVICSLDVLVRKSSRDSVTMVYIWNIVILTFLHNPA